MRGVAEAQAHAQRPPRLEAAAIGELREVEDAVADACRHALGRDVVQPHGELRRSAVDHTSYDTTSILRMIERRYGLAPLDTRFGRDARVNDLGRALLAAGGRY